MNSSQRKQFLLTVAASAAVICVIILFFFRTSIFAAAFSRTLSILMPFIYGIVIAYLLHPVSVMIEKGLNKIFDRGGSGKHSGLIRLAAIILSILLLLAALILLLLAIIPEVISSVSGLLKQLPQVTGNFETWIASLDNGDTSHEAVTYVQSVVDTLNENLESFLQSGLLPYLQNMVTDMTSSFAGLISVIKNFGLGCIISAYILGSWEKFGSQLKMTVYGIFPEKAADWIRDEVHFADEKFSGFIVGKIIDSLIIGILCFVFTVIVKMPYAMLVSIIVGVTNIIPFFGPYLGAIPSALLILTVSPAKCLIFIVFIIILQQVDGNVIGPKILGDKLGLSSFWILFSIMVFGAVWGIVGMLVGAPIFAVIYDLIRKEILLLLDRRGKQELAKEYEEQFPKK